MIIENSSIKKVCFLLIFVCIRECFAKEETSLQAKDLIEEAIEKIDIVALKDALQEKLPLTLLEKVKYTELAEEKFNKLKQEFEFEKCAEKFGKIQFHSGKAVLGFMGFFMELIFLPMGIAFYFIDPEHFNLKKYLGLNLLSWPLIFYCLGQGGQEEEEYKKKREQDYKNAREIKYIIMAL